MENRQNKPPEGGTASGHGGQKFHTDSEQAKLHKSKLRMESREERLNKARERLAKQKPPKKPGPIKRIARIAGHETHAFLHGKVYQEERDNVGVEGGHFVERSGEAALHYGRHKVRRAIREHPAKAAARAESRYIKATADYHSRKIAQEQPEWSGTPTPSPAQRITVAQGSEIARLTFSGNAEEAIRALHHTLQTNFSSSPDMFLLRMLLTDVLVTMFNAVPSGEQGTEVQQAIVATSRALQKAMTHAEAEEQMDTLIGAVAVKYTSSAETDQPELLSRILQCVQDHFCEHDFNVSRAADLLGLSVAYLSKYFKQQTGVNLLNYLNSLRIDYAKKLMDEEQITVAEAADRAGYESANTFIRLFKKYAGDTPGNYNKH